MGLIKEQRPVLEKNRRVVINAVDAAITLDPELEDGSHLFQTGALTGVRIVTLPTGGRSGNRIHITRTAAATGASALDVGGLKNLAVSEWCEVTHDGTAYVLSSFGAGVT